MINKNKSVQDKEIKPCSHPSNSIYYWVSRDCTGDFMWAGCRDCGKVLGSKKLKGVSKLDDK